MSTKLNKLSVSTKLKKLSVSIKLNKLSVSTKLNKLSVPTILSKAKAMVSNIKHDIGSTIPQDLPCFNLITLVLFFFGLGKKFYSSLKRRLSLEITISAL